MILKLSMNLLLLSVVEPSRSRFLLVYVVEVVPFLEEIS